MDYKLFLKINEYNKYFICRIKKNTIAIDTNQDDIIFIKNSITLRIIKYDINNTLYYLCTNLIDIYNIDTLKQLYHKRWLIEENFKLIKKQQ